MTLVDGKDPDAFEVFYDRHGGAAYSLAHRIVGDREIAEDVAQEAFLSIWRSKARFDAARGSVRAWVLGIVRNRAIDSLCAAPRGPPRSSTATTRRRSRASRPRERTEAEAIRRETAGRLRQALGSFAARAVAGDRVGLLRRLQPLGDSRDARCTAWHHQGADAPRSREDPGDPRGGHAGGRSSRGLTCEPRSHDTCRPRALPRRLGGVRARRPRGNPRRPSCKRHLAECEACRIELRWLEPAVDMLPRSIRAA